MVTLKARNKSTKENIQLLELAVSCKLITEAQEKVLLKEVLADEEQNDKISVAQSFYKNNILEKDQIEFLFAVKKHLDLLMLDKKFGNLGIANKFVLKEDIDSALDIQVDIFKKKHKSVKIGDILVLKNAISEADKTAILLTQDRIRDSYLAQALNKIARDEIEKAALNKRFGAIAVKTELITEKQLSQALEIQQKEIKKKGEKRYLGDILKEHFNLTDEDIIKILKIQKKLEVKRMNLQQKVFSFNVEKESINVLEQFLSLQVSEDKLEAFVHVKEAGAPRIDSRDLVNWLFSSGIKYGICPAKKIQEFFEKPEKGSRFKIAKGLAPAVSKKEQIRYYFDIKAADNYPAHETDSKNLVKKDEVLATVIPFEPGSPGRDVFGHPVIIEQDDTVYLASGKGVTRRDNDFIALLDGIPKIYQNRTLFVIPVEAKTETREIEGDLTQQTAEQFQDCDLTVSGNISRGANVICRGLKVQGDALGSISAAGDVEISGNIGSEEDMASGMPVVQIKTAGRLKVNGSRICARIITNKGLNAPNTEVVNSRIFSSGNVTVKDITSSPDNPTTIRITQKNAAEREKLDDLIRKEQSEIDKLTLAPELNSLSKELMDNVQIQQNYLENLNVISYLMKIMEHPDLSDLASMEQKIKAFEKQNMELPETRSLETIPKNTKAHKFMTKTIAKMETVEPENYHLFTKELRDTITDLFKTAVKATDRLNKTYEVKCRQIEESTKEHKEKIKEKERKIKDLLARRDYLQFMAQQEASEEQLFIKVSNKLGQHTVIKGKEARLVIENPVHGVHIRERDATEKTGAEMLVQGSFE